MATLYVKRGKFYIEYVLNGKNITKNTFLEAKRENAKKASEMKKDIEAEIRKTRQTSLKNEFRFFHREEIKLSDSVEKYKRMHLSARSKAHQNTFVHVINQFYKFVEPNTNIWEISTEHISEFINQLGTKIRNASIRTYVNYLKGFFNYLVEEEILEKSPIRNKIIPRPIGNNIVTFEQDMLDKILEEAKRTDTDFYHILMMLLLTGVRPCDLLKLKVGDIDVKNLLIHLNISKTRRQIEFPLYDQLLKFLVNEMLYINKLEKDDHLFPGFNVNMLGKKFRRLKKKLKIDDKYVYTLKTFRKTFATKLAEKGMDRADVADLLGHSIIETTRKYYVNTKAKTLRERLNKLV